MYAHGKYVTHNGLCRYGVYSRAGIDWRFLGHCVSKINTLYGDSLYFVFLFHTSVGDLDVDSRL